MLTFVIRRMIATVFVVFTITVLVFLIFFHTPGVDPARKLAGRNPSPETIKAIKHQYGLDRPLPVQYVILMKKLFITRDLTSYSNQGQKVVPEIVAATPVTLSLVLGAAVIWVVVSIIMGVAAAVLRGTILDPLLMVLGLIGISMPVFWLGEVINLLTQSTLHDSLFHWVPALGYTPLTQDPVMWFKHLVIPWLVLSVLYIGLYARVLRADLLETENEDYVRTARAKGLSERRVMTRHVLRNSLIPIIALWGLDFAAVIGGGAILTESVFNLQGVGQYAAQSIAQLDVPPILVIVMLGAACVVVLSAITDVAFAVLDPRIRLGG
jgi:peptide/nickel transport system permease protein